MSSNNSRSPWRTLPTSLLTLTVAFLATAMAPPTSPVSSRETTESTELPPKHQDFLQLAAPLLHPTERSIFLALDKNYRRDSFIQRFWRTRDPFPDTPRNELRERLEENLSGNRVEIEESSADEATILLLHGKPTRRFRDACDLLESINVWYYRSSPLVPAEFFAVFHRRTKEWQLWNPSEGIEVLTRRLSTFNDAPSLERIQRECSRGDQILSALTLSLDWEAVHQRILGTPNPEWAQAFLESSAQTGDSQHSLAMQATSNFVGRRQSRVVVQTSLTLLPGETSALARRVESSSTQFILDGEIVRQEELFDSFRYRFDLPSGDSEGSQTPILMVERYLRPGSYRLVLEVREPATGRSWHLDQKLEVPPLQVLQEPIEDLVTARIDDADSSAAKELQNLDSAPPTNDLLPSLRLSVPSRQLLTGQFRAAAIVEGPTIRRVAFELDGKRVLSKARPPYSVELNAGRVPRTHQLVALAFDGNGNEVARDEVTLNAGPRRFAVRLLEPRRGGQYQGRVRAVAEVDVPPLEKLENVEFFLNDDRVATLYQQPFALPITFNDNLPLAFVRVVANLSNGQQTEDLVFVNSPHAVEYLDVNLVEVYTSVTNRRGQPIKGLSRDQFQVFEDGRPQTIVEFRQVEDLAIHACVLFDTSTSMIERLEEAKAAALHFFELVLEERDRACLMTFNDVHELVVDFTHSPEVLAGGLSGVMAEGETALYDSLIHTLYLFNGMRGKRAIILLSDGADSTSDYRFNDVLEFARRSEVTIHAIGVDIDTRDIEARARLSQLAKETGGRTFFIDEIKELRRVYDLIEMDLRSQYLLAYQSDGQGERNQFRKVLVKMIERKMKARALSGYYP